MRNRDTERFTKPNQKLLCEIKGGSHAYGLNTPTSDLDIRGVFVHTDAAYLVGLKKDEILVEQNEQHDRVMTEFRHVLRLLRNANSQMVELLYIHDYEYIDPAWLQVTKVRQHLVSSTNLFNSLRGYLKSELLLANGLRTGKLGSKRKEMIDKYGFSPKNFVQCLRLAWAGSIYFTKGYFPVNIRTEDEEYANKLYHIKTQPDHYNLKQLNEMAAIMEQNMIATYENRKSDTTFNEDIANQLCISIYKPLIIQL